MSVTAPLAKIPAPRKVIAESEFVTNCIALGVKKPNSVLAALSTTTALTEGTHVDLTPNFIGGLGLQALTSVLYKNRNLVSLNVSNNGLSNESVVFFCRSFVDHPTLKELNLSHNPLTLPAGEALLQLVQRNTVIEEIHVAGTMIEENILRHIRRALNLRRQGTAGGGSAGREASKKKIAATSPNAVSTPYQRVLLEFEPKREAKKAARAQERVSKEDKALVELKDIIRVRKLSRPAVDRVSGWTVINVAIIAAPNIFNSELEIIVNDIIPSLNATYSAQKLFFNVLENPPQEEAGKNVDVNTFVVMEDYLSDLRKSNVMVIELIGDRIGLIEHVPALHALAAEKKGGHTKSGDGKHSTPLHPLQYTLHETAKALEEVLHLSCTRNTSRHLNLPDALAPIFSDEPPLVHPDAQASAVKAAVAKARGIDHKLLNFDIQVVERAWNIHREFQENVSKTTPDALLVNNFSASFDRTDMKGRVYLKDLNGFADHLRARTKIIAAAVAEMQPKLVNAPDLKKAALLQRCIEISGVRKNILGKLDLYAVTPPSRNMLLLHGAPGSALTTTIGAFLQRSSKKPNYTVASHFARQPQFFDEPSDLRSLFLSLIQQLSTDKAVMKYVESEIDVMKVQDVFSEVITKISGSLEEGKVLILAIDGIDDLDEAVLPSQALRKSDTGADIWKPSLNHVEALGLKPTTPKLTQADSDSNSSVNNNDKERDRFSFIPLCLPRNVRVVGTSVSQSPATTELEARGRDSTELLLLPDNSANEIDLLVNGELQRLGMTATDDDLNNIREKMGSASTEYLSFVLDGLRSLKEAPGYLTPSAFIETMPPTVTGYCEHILHGVENAFGASWTKNALGLILFSRWGLTEMNLRELLSTGTTGGSDSRRFRFPSSDLNRFLRLLRPVLLQGTQAAGEGTNAMFSIVYIRSRTFRHLLMTKYFATPEAVTTIHQQLAHHYRRLTQLTAPHPLARTAFKEFPFHAISAKLWNIVNETVFSLDFVSRSYQLGLGYQIFRECIHAYNTFEAVDPSSIPTINKQSILDKMKEYVYFIRGHNINLVQFPHLVAQIAIGTPANSHVHMDALVYFKQHTDVPHIVVANRSTGKLHREAVTDLQYAPNGIRFASCSDDRSIRLLNLFGESILQICQSASKLKILRYSTTSRYLLAATEDRSTFIFDATSGQLVSKGQGHAATIRCAELSVRGKFYATGSDDRTMKVWESETGALLATASHSHFTVSSSTTGGVAQVLPHPLSEDTFFTICDKKIAGWKLTHLRDSCEEILCIQGHNTLPLSWAATACDGSYLIACARETPLKEHVAVAAQAPHTEDNIKIWSSTSGRLLATFARGPNSNTPGASFAVLAPSEKRLASALVDGSIQVYNIEWRSYATNNGEVEVIQPYLHLEGYLRHANPICSALRFSHDSAILCATGNLRQVKLWAVVGADLKVESKPFGLQTYAEYLHEQPITAVATSPNPQEEGGSIAIGDVTGRILSLKLNVGAQGQTMDRVVHV